ncbi:hypothetical protein SKAU_G00085630 [Synaphobranchus kaupii]|uniref:Uncharacterized protein n=1 Tax=Synaphobranchus kaupii TaxID=118154 RepID=A0A9Q1J3R1_SYNKA|nr:hypothetical protein SKAU_G00085630 [Synaphobranchus kaupii]
MFKLPLELRGNRAGTRRSEPFPRAALLWTGRSEGGAPNGRTLPTGSCLRGGSADESRRVARRWAFGGALAVKRFLSCGGLCEPLSEVPHASGPPPPPNDAWNPRHLGRDESLPGS